MSDDRLHRIEEKVDKLADAVVEMARMEERLVTVFKRMDDMGGMLKKMDDRLDDMERQAIVRGQKIAFAERIFWMIATGAVGLAFVFLR
jgi:predicted  nucleic acid-binding Zn-ribbon protein